ncbi:hypothetical protein [Phytomonospora endophytica]|uniref:Uncharacterized protein n=1 Tax=Phytomonospora endophytica TaxID=714109 RepID=A0A841G2U6_9ACTN|nr:hypothetical protein [Phytomonospora endophytica]MBB6039957.1 hypothetical protein [Phytomonospora endophytica]GIG70972.1 hypothetical protein Pen01_72670 [Phytomonospora endophytica]
MTNNDTLSAQSKTTIRTAAQGAVALIAYAGVAGSPHKIATHGSLAYGSATGLVGHVLAPKKNDVKLDYSSAAALADQTLPALADSVRILREQAPDEVDNFRSTINVAVQAAAQAGRGEVSPPVAEMLRKIEGALDAA